MPEDLMTQLDKEQGQHLQVACGTQIDRYSMDETSSDIKISGAGGWMDQRTNGKMD